jgi:hypothetical protein
MNFAGGSHGVICMGGLRKTVNTTGNVRIMLHCEAFA